MFRKRDTPASVKGAGLAKWYAGISDQERVRLGRYAEGISADSPGGFFLKAADAAVADENWSFVVFLVEQAYAFGPDDLSSYLLNEALIEAYYGLERYDDVVAACDANMALFPKLSEEPAVADGTYRFRNRQIDVRIGIFCEYDRCQRLLEEFVEMGAMPADELPFRKNSLKIHRMQRALDGVYSYTPIKDSKE